VEKSSIFFLVARQCTSSFRSDQHPVIGEKNGSNALPSKTPPLLTRFKFPNYFLLPKLNMVLKGNRFALIEEIQEAVTSKLN